MNATQVIEEIRQLPESELERVYQYLFSSEAELELALAGFDRLPRATRLTEDTSSGASAASLSDEPDTAK